jgi:integrase
MARNQTNHRRFGNVGKLPSGRYRARWTGPDGFVHKAPDTFATAEEADAWLAAQRVGRATKNWVDERDGAMPLRVLAEQWKLTRQHKRASTRARDLGYLERYILPTFGDRAVADITATDCDVWVSELTAAELAPATIVKAAQLLGSIFDRAVRDRRRLDNPARDLELPKVERAKVRALSPTEVEKLAGEIDPRYRAMVVVGCYTGLRLGELTALTAGDVDLGRRRLTVSRNTVEVEGHLSHGQVKTAAGRRVVPLSAVALEALTPLVEGAGHPDDLLFTAPDGGYLRAAGWRSRFWRPAVKAAGLEGLTPHDMRHTAISIWLAAGTDPKAVAVWAGHRSVVTVLDVYGHLMPDHADAHLARLDAYVDGQTV